MRPGLLLVGLGLVLLLLFGLYRYEPVEEYRPRLLLHLNLAEEGAGGDGAAGAAALPEPLLFGVDARGNLYLLGKELGGLLVFDPSGRTLRHRLALNGLPGAVRDMGVGEPGSLYLVTEPGSSLFSLRLSGERGAGEAESGTGSPEPELREIRLPLSAAAGEEGGSHRVEEVIAADSGQAYAVTLGISHRRYVRELWQVPPRGKPGRLLRLEVTEEGVGSGEGMQALPHGSLAVTPWGELWVEVPDPEKGERRLWRIDRTGRVTAGFTLPGGADPGFRLAGADERGSLYVGVGLGSPGGRVVKYSPEGSQQWEVAVPAGEGTTGLTVRADAGGNLYVLRRQAGSLSVEKWKVERRWRLR